MEPTYLDRLRTWRMGKQRRMMNCSKHLVQVVRIGTVVLRLQNVDDRR